MKPSVVHMRSGLHTRLVFMLIAPLCVVSLINAWFDYRSAAGAALHRDTELRRMVPLLRDSIIVAGAEPDDLPMFLLAPPIEEFLRDQGVASAIDVTDMSGQHLHGDPWLDGLVPASNQPEFRSEEHDGVTYRVMSLRVRAAVGEVVIRLADGSDLRQQWGRTLWWRVIAPNIGLVMLAGLTIHWTVRRALRPLLELTNAVENRSPNDLDQLDVDGSPAEVRPLVRSLNRLFLLVTQQAQSQQRFVADAAHQLRTPLAGLQAQVEAWAQAANRRTVLKNVRAESTIELSAGEVNKLLLATRRTSQLASQLLALSRADSNSAHSQPMRPVDLREVCVAILEQHLDAASLKGIDLGLDAEAVEVMGHEWLLRELVSNLTDNAVKYAGKNGTVTLRCGMRNEPRGGPFLEVEDDGPGIEAGERQKVFERFYRVHGTVEEGNGLGLPIASEITRAHGGELTLHNGSKGVGLKVVALFPRA